MPVSIEAVSRRQFLQSALALGAAVAMPRSLVAANSPAPAYDHLALLSDVHVSGGLNGAMADHLTVAVRQVLRLRPQTVLVAGDCAYLTGGKNDYREYARRIGPVIDAKIPMHMTMGNHDQRDRFWDVLPGEQVEENLKLRRQAMVLKGRNANWFMLDSLDKTNHDSGILGSDQLDWLAAELDGHADKPALVMLHHDPIRQGKQGSLEDSEKLMSITRPRRQVKALFFGHTHVWDVAQDSSGIHLINLPATGYLLWFRSFLGWVTCRLYETGAALNIHTLTPGQKQDGEALWLKWRV